MDIGDWKAVPQTGALWKRIKELDLVENVAELDTFGFTILPPGKAAPLTWVDGLRDRLLEVAEERTGIKHDIEAGTHGVLPGTEPQFKHQYILYYLLNEGRVFEEAVTNPYLLALQTHMLGWNCRIQSCTSFVKWQDETGYGPTLGLHIDNPVDHPAVHANNTHSANSAWLLTDYTEDNGPIAFVPGSHRRGRSPRPGEGVDEAIPVEAPAGSLLVWSGNLWHGGYPRKNDGLRLVLTCYFGRSYLIPQEDYRGLPDEVVARNPERFKSIIGLTNPNMWTDWRGPQFSSVGAMQQAISDQEGVPIEANPYG